MNHPEKSKITVQVEIQASLERVWKLFTTPEDVVKWNSASSDWHTTKSEIDLREGGGFNHRMEAKDGSEGFDFWGTYEVVATHKQLDSLLGDGRRTSVSFFALGDKTVIKETFEAEDINTIELQRGGWQAILDNFKSYAERRIKGILVVAHGSRSREAVAEFEKVVEIVQQNTSFDAVKGAHMEISSPDIPTATKELAVLGVTEIIVIPYFLFMGNHTKLDIPEIINGQKLLYPEIDFKLGKPFGVDTLIADLIIKRIGEVDN